VTQLDIDDLYKLEADPKWKGREKDTALRWFFMNDTERVASGLPMTQTQLAIVLGIHSQALTGWKKGWRDFNRRKNVEESLKIRLEQAERELDATQKALAIKTNETMGQAVDTRSDGEKTADELAQAIKDMDEAVYEAATVKNIAKMAELWYKRQGLLVDRKEEKADSDLNIAQLIREAESELEDEGMA